MLNRGRKSILYKLDTTATDLGLLLNLKNKQKGKRNQEIFRNSREFNNYILYILGQDIYTTENRIEMACIFYKAY